MSVMSFSKATASMSGQMASKFAGRRKANFAMRAFIRLDLRMNDLMTLVLRYECSHDLGSLVWRKMSKM